MMAYMCTESGNLMAIAQQVMKQKQQQQRQHQESVVVPAMHAAMSDGDPFGGVPAQWANQRSPGRDHFPFALPEPPFQDPFSAGVLGFPPPSHLDHAPFRISEFDSDEWMDSLIGESPTESSEIVWQGTDLPPIFPDAFASSDLDRLVFPDSRKIVAPLPISFDPQPMKDPGKSPPPLLFKSLLDCARIVDSNPDLAVKAIEQIRNLASDIGDPAERVAFYFAEALTKRLSGRPAPEFQQEDITLCYKAFNDACPYSKFIHLTANQAILEATESADRIHIIDFGIDQGIQWAALLQALANRATGKPTRIRISGMASLRFSSPPTPLAATGNRLRDFARLLDLDFEFEPVLLPVHDLTTSCFRVEPGDAVAVNFTLQLCGLLGEGDESVNRLIRLAKSVRPSVVTLGEYECNLNRVGFEERFGNALEYFAAVYESVDSAMGRDSEDRARFERVILGPRILNIVGPGEDAERGVGVRMEPKEKWRVMMEGCGMEMVPPSNYAVSQAKLLLWNYDYSPKYSLLDSHPGFLSLAWEDLPLFTVSSWRLPWENDL